MVRSLTCFQCKNMGLTKGKNAQSPERCKCNITKRWGNLQRGRYCEKFEYRPWGNAIAPDGIPIKNRQPLDYRTEKQWLEEGRSVKADAHGVDMHSSKHSWKIYRYYLIEDTEEI